MYARPVLSTSDPTLDADLTLGGDGAPVHAPAYDELQRGDSIGRYLVLRPLGRGGMGAVYAAHDPELDRTVAVKIVSRSGSRPASLKEEAQTLARLSHPNVVSVHDVGELPDGVFIAMEFVEGQTLRKWSDAHRGDLSALSSVMRDAGKGLAAAHQAGLVHLDFKPDNVMIADDGRVLVLDFGLAQPKNRTPTGTDVSPLGTPAYMPPEQHRKEPVDDRADQFAYCVTWLESALGQRPFAGDTPSTTTRAILDGDSTLPPRPAAMRREVWQALLRGISVDREQRWPSMAELLEATEPPRSTRRQTVIAAVAAGSLGAVGMWALAAPEARCANAAIRVEHAWSERDAAAFRALELDDAGVTDGARVQVVDRLDAYADELAAGYDEACRVAPDNAPRTVCLDARLEQLRATRDFVLDSKSAEAVRSLKFENTLQGVDACRRADEEALYREVSDPERAQAVLGGLARGMVALDAGLLDDATEELRGVVSEADALEWWGVESIARVKLGEAAAYRGDVDTMHAEYEQALELATKAGSDEATYAALSMRLEEYAQTGDAAAVQALAPVVGAAARRAGNPGITVPMSLGNVLQLNGDYDGAEAAYASILKMDPDSRTRLNALSNLGGLQLYRGKFVEAKALFEQALPGSIEVHGATSVSRLKMQANLADANQQLGAYAEARSLYEEALQLYANVGTEKTRAAQHLTLNYATLLISLGEHELAERVGGAAAKQLVELYGADHVFVLAARDFGSNLAMARGRHAEALAATGELITHAMNLLGGDGPLVGFLRATQAKAALELDERVIGMEAVKKARPVVASLNPDHPLLVTLSWLQAELQLAGDDVMGAKAAAEEAVRRAQGASVPPVDRGRAHLARAKVRLAQGADAKAELQRAAEAFALAPEHPDARVELVATLAAGDREVSPQDRSTRAR